MGRRRGLAHAIGDARLFEIVRTHLHLHPVARGDLDEVLPQLARNVGQHHVPVGQFNPEHRAGQTNPLSAIKRRAGADSSSMPLLGYVPPRKYDGEAQRPSDP